MSVFLQLLSPLFLMKAQMGITEPPVSLYAMCNFTEALSVQCQSPPFPVVETKQPGVLGCIK